MAYNDDETSSAEEKDDAVILADIKKKWKEADEGLSEWLTESRESYDFVAGNQWSEDDVRVLREQDRPTVVFNRIQSMIDAVCGIEVNNRQEIKYFPRTIEDVRPNEILTAAAKWARDNCNAEDEESEAFQDAAICGIGVTETRMDYDDDPDGKVLQTREDPLLCRWWPGAKKKCLEDTPYVLVGKWVDKATVEAMWPDADIITTDENLDYIQPGDGDKSFHYDGDTQGQEMVRNRVFLVHYQCYKYEPFYRVLDPFQQKVVTLSKNDFDNLRNNSEKLGLSFAEQGSASEGQVPYVEQKKKVYYRGFYVGNTLLEYDESPSQDGFTIKFITAKRDRNKNCWYGLVRHLKDPQRWGNKFLSQILHIINTNAKGGAFVEENALKNPKKAEEQWGSANPLIELNEGGIAKVKERTVAPYPTGLDRLMMFSFDTMPLVSGLPLEIMGTTGREQAGVLEEQRKRAAISVLSGLFDSLRRFRKSQGRLLLTFIQDFLSDGRIIRITGNQGDMQYVQLLKQDDTTQYDVIVDQAPYSTDMKERVWNALSQSAIPALIKQGVPIPESLWNYSPLPSDVARDVANAQKGQLPPQVQQQMQKMQQALQQAGEEVQKLKAENLQLKVDATVDMAKAQMNYDGKIASIQQKESADQRLSTIESARVMLEAREAAINERIATLNADMEKFRAVMEAQSKAVELEGKKIDRNIKLVQLAQSASEKKEGGEKESEPKNINITLDARGGRRKAKKVNGEWIVEDVG